MKKMIFIVGLNKAEVLAALYNRAITGGMGFVQYKPEPMTVEQARKILRYFEKVTRRFLFWTVEVRPASKCIYFGELAGRYMKLDLTSDIQIDCGRYNRENGENAAEDAIRALEETGDINPPSTQRAHRIGVLMAAEETADRLNEILENDVRGDDIHTASLSKSDIAKLIRPKIQYVKKYYEEQD